MYDFDVQVSWRTAYSVLKKHTVAEEPAHTQFTYAIPMI